jgi:hypothetical protein
MFPHLKVEFRQIIDLPFVVTYDRFIAQIMTTTCTLAGRVLFNPLRCVGLSEGMSFMPLLSPRLLAALAAQARAIVSRALG